LIDQLTLQDLLREATGDTTVEAAVRRAGADTLARRQLIEALFYVGTKQRDAGNERKCQEFMATAAGPKVVLIVQEWYLARAEAESQRADAK
jgi:hypothetical protein